jgi:PAS domain-containing protein
MLLKRSSLDSSKERELMSEDPLSEVRKLQKAVQRVAESIGLEVEGFAISPGQGGKDRLQVLFKILPEAVQTTDEKQQLEFNDAFEALIGKEFQPEADKDEQGSEAEDALKKFQNWFE